jgi:hypothetical protein
MSLLQYLFKKNSNNPCDWPYILPKSLTYKMISDSNQVHGISLKHVKKKQLTRYNMPCRIDYIHKKSIGNKQLCEDAIDFYENRYI